MIMKSTNGGENWNDQNSGTTENLNVIRFYDANIGMCAGDNGIVLTTTDGGNNWNTRSTDTADSLGLNSIYKLCNGYGKREVLYNRRRK